MFDFFTNTPNEKFIEQYDLQPFDLNVLNKEQTMLEKTVSLIRFSFDENVVESISKKIRHFYDLYFLMKDTDCVAFMKSKDFKLEFNKILEHDREVFDEPEGWQTKSISDSALITDFENIWNKLKDNYKTELTELAYTAIPDERSVADNFNELIKLVK